MTVQSYKELTVWKKSIDLVHEIYALTNQLPKSEVYGLCSQMQRAAVAIPSNIAEGYKRNHRLEFVQFLSIANGSAGELETQLIIITRQYPNLDCKKALGLLTEIQKMLFAIIKTLKNKSTR